jgi:CheY-like chemotaxis protein
VHNPIRQRRFRIVEHMGYRVLIVEDDADLREAIVVLLTQEGFETEVAGNGEEALEKARAHPPDLIVLDLLMPVMDGWMFRAHQRYDPVLTTIPVVLLTGIPIARLKNVGAAAALQKPFNPEQLVAAIRAHC